MIFRSGMILSKRRVPVRPRSVDEATSLHPYVQIPLPRGSQSRIPCYHIPPGKPPMPPEEIPWLLRWSPRNSKHPNRGTPLQIDHPHERFLRAQQYAVSYLHLSSSIRHLPSAICYLPSAICHLPSAICNPQSAICNPQSAICHLLSAICHLLSAIPHPLLSLPGFSQSVILHRLADPDSSALHATNRFSYGE